MTDRHDEVREENLPNAEDLGGGSEDALKQAQREDPTEPEERPDGPPRREPLNPDPDELGRRYLEDATEAPAHPKKKASIQSIEARPLSDLFTD